MFTCLVNSSGHDSDQGQETWRYTSGGSPVVKGVQELNPDLHLPSSHPKPDDPVQEDRCPLQCVKTSPADIINEAKLSASPKSGASCGEEFRITSYGPTKKSEGITELDDILEGDSLAQLELSVAPPCSLSPSKGPAKQKMHTSADSVPAKKLLCSNMFQSNDMNSRISERSCKPTIDDARSDEHLDTAKPSNPNHSMLLHEEMVEIPDEKVQEMDYHSTLNDENPCSSTTEDGINCEQACDGKVSSVLSMNVPQQDPCLQVKSII